MNNYEFINYINAKLVCENISKPNYNYFVNIGPLFGYTDECSLYLILNDKLKEDYEGHEVYTLLNSLDKDNWFEILYNGLDTYKPGEDYKFSESLYNLIQQEINNKNNITSQSPTFNNNIYDEQNRELNQKIKQFEQKNGDLTNFVFNENKPYLHTMKMKGEIFENLPLDAEFENADLLDYLGYERIISCKKNNKK